MEIEEIKEIIKQQLPLIMQTDKDVEEFILQLSSQYYADKIETETRFDRMLREIQKDREEHRKEDNRKWEAQKQEDNRKWEEQNRKWEAQKQEDKREWEEHRQEDKRWWEEYKQEDKRKWEEQNRKWEEEKQEDKRRWEEQNRKWEEEKQEDKRKWDEQNRKWDENQKEIHKLPESMKRRYDQTIGALGARWGLRSEASFRNALAGILEESFKVEVLHITEFDDKGEVFGRPDQVELDVLIKNGFLIICEIKSSISKPEVYVFDKKIRFYEKLHTCKADRRIIISPMVDDKAAKLAAELDMEVYSYADAVKK